MKFNESAPPARAAFSRALLEVSVVGWLWMPWFWASSRLLSWTSRCGVGVYLVNWRRLRRWHDQGPYLRSRLGGCMWMPWSGRLPEGGHACRRSSAPKFSVFSGTSSYFGPLTAVVANFAYYLAVGTPVGEVLRPKSDDYGAARELGSKL
jgi:hypothetical protein